MGISSFPAAPALTNYSYSTPAFYDISLAVQIITLLSEYNPLHNLYYQLSAY
nr:MAG TPA: hypothetical protein [Caudoviricetes sp.]